MERISRARKKRGDLTMTKKTFSCCALVEEENMKLFRSYCADHEFKIKEAIGDLITKCVKRECIPKKGVE